MRRKSRRKEVSTPEGEQPAEGRDSSPSSPPLPPGPTARWLWKCDVCRKAFVARVRPAVDNSGRDRLYVWDYETHETLRGDGLRWVEVEDETAPPCPQCGNPSKSVGPAEFEDHLEEAYQHLRKLLKARRGEKTTEAFMGRTDGYSREHKKQGPAARLFGHGTDCTCDECKDAKRDEPSPWGGP